MARKLLSTLQLSPPRLSTVQTGNGGLSEVGKALDFVSKLNGSLPLANIIACLNQAKTRTNNSISLCKHLQKKDWKHFIAFTIFPIRSVTLQAPTHAVTLIEHQVFGDVLWHFRIR